MESGNSVSPKKRLLINIAIMASFTVLMVACIFLMRGELMRQAHETYTLLTENYAQEESNRIGFYSSLMELSTGYIAEMKERGASNEAIEESFFLFIEGYDKMFEGVSAQCYGIIDGQLFSNQKSLNSPEHQGHDFTEDEWYRVAMKGNGVVCITDSYEDRITGNPCVTVAQKVEGTDDALAFDLFFTGRPSFSEEIGLPPECSYCLCDSNGTIMYYTTPWEVSKEEAQKTVEGVLDNAPEDRLFHFDDVITSESHHLNAYIERISTGWYVILGVPEDIVASELLPIYAAVAVMMAIWLVSVGAMSARDYLQEKRRVALLQEREFLVRDRDIIEKTTASTLAAYRELFYIDLANNIMQVVYSSNKGEKRSARYTDSLQNYISYGIIDPMDADRFINTLSLGNLRKELSEKNFLEIRFRIVRPDGTAESFVITVAVIEREGAEPLSAAMSIRSVEGLLQKEQSQRSLLKAAADQAAAASQAKSSFLSRMSHDIRTPMNAIQGMTSIALMNIDDKERVEDALHKISISSDHLLGLINSVLDMSKIESGAITLANNKFAIPVLMSKLAAMFETAAASKGITLCFVYGNAADCNVYGDEARLKELMVNIIGNSIKFTETGGSVKVSAHMDAKVVEGKRRFAFIVEDTGIGMSEDFIEQIFEPFVRANDKVVAKIEGTGLGMPIALNIARLMGGDIKVESELGNGSKFTIIVFLGTESSGGATDDALEAANPDQGQAQQHGSQGDLNRINEFKECDFTGKHALVVDDVSINSEIAVELLGVVGIESDVASNGKEAVEKLASGGAGRYDIVFMDVQMPVMDGYEATQKVRDIADSEGLHYLKDVPIVAMTANAFTEDIRAAQEAGMDDHVAKPLNLRDMRQVLEKWLA